MPVRQGQDTSPLAFYWAIPPVTRSLATALLATRLLSALSLLPVLQFVLHWPSILWKLQVWRLVLPFLYLYGKPFEVLILLMWTVQYGRILEESVFQNRTADFIWMLLVSGVAMLALTVLPLLHVLFLGNALAAELLYLWSRNFPTAQVSFFGLVSLQAFFLPFVQLGLAVLLNNDWRPVAIGILVGHMYYYLTAIYPATGGRSLIKTPEWLKRKVLQYRIGQMQVSDVPSVRNPSAPGFQPFSGAGRRLS